MAKKLPVGTLVVLNVLLVVESDDAILLDGSIELNGAALVDGMAPVVVKLP